MSPNPDTVLRTAEEEPNPSASTLFLECAALEEDSAAFLESLPAATPRRSE